jgi:hypothetical protein
MKDMADVVIVAMAISSAASLLIVNPHEAKTRALGALRAYGETQALPTAGRGQDLAKPAPHIFSTDSVERSVLAIRCRTKAEHGPANKLRLNRSLWLSSIKPLPCWFW